MVPEISLNLSGDGKIGAAQTMGMGWTRVKELNAVRRRRSALKMVDRALSKGNWSTALSLVKQLQGKPGGLRGFGAAKQVPQGMLSLEELNIREPDISSLRSLLGSIVESIKDSIQLSLSEELSLLELERLMHTESGDTSLNDHLKCMQHEAGHFLVGYLLGVLPKGYSVPTMEALKQDKFVEGMVQFLGFEFLKEVDADYILSHKFPKEKLCHQTVNRLLSVIVGGLVAEHMVFGCSEGLHADVERLEKVLNSLEFTEDEAQSRLKWAVLNTLLILSRHREARSRLAEAMALGRSVGFCIDTIETALNFEDI